MQRVIRVRVLVELGRAVGQPDIAPCREAFNSDLNAVLQVLGGVVMSH